MGELPDTHKGYGGAAGSCRTPIQPGRPTPRQDFHASRLRPGCGVAEKCFSVPEFAGSPCHPCGFVKSTLFSFSKLEKAASMASSEVSSPFTASILSSFELIFDSSALREETPFTNFSIALQIAKRQPIAQPANANKTVICQMDISVLTASESMRRRRVLCPCIISACLPHLRSFYLACE